MSLKFENDHSIRLAYQLNKGNTPDTFLLIALVLDASPRYVLSEQELRNIRRKLHPLDQTIAQQILQGPIYSYLSSTQLARLLPLLVRRQTHTPIGTLLQLDKKPFSLAFEMETASQSLYLYLDHTDLGKTAFSDGYLLCGAQAFFLLQWVAYPVKTLQPLALLQWLQNNPRAIPSPYQDLTLRDNFIKDLQHIGVPAHSLQPLEIQTATALSFIVEGQGITQEEGEPLLCVALKAKYGTQEFKLPTHGLSTHTLLEKDDGTLVSRSLEAETQAIQLLESIGFTYSTEKAFFVAQGDALFDFLEQPRQNLPPEWLLEGNFSGITLHRHLDLNTQILFKKEEGVIDLRIQAQVKPIATPMPIPNLISNLEVNDISNTNALLDTNTSSDIDIPALMAWLRTPKKYFQLKDGSFVLPSKEVRRSLHLLKDIGVQAERALISPLCVGVLRSMNQHLSVQSIDETTQAWLAEVATSQGPAQVPVPRGLTSTLRDYQRSGLDWLMMLYRYGLTGILADDMGLGKTLQTLAFLLALKESEGSEVSLVIAPTSVINVWVDEARQHTPPLNVLLWYGPPSQRIGLPDHHVDVIVTSYGIIRRDIEKLSQIAFRYVILDEAQHAKNAQTHSAFAIRKIKSKYRLALSGTPMENTPEELWSVFDFLAPGFLGSLPYFRKHYSKPILQGEQTALELLSTRISPLILRRLKSEVAKDLPEKVETVVRCVMGTAQRALYEEVAAELRTSLGKKLKEQGFAATRMDVFAAITRLRQICCDPHLLPTPPDSKIPPSAKLALFEELMREALASDRCVVVFSQFVQMQRRLIQVIRRLGVEPLWLHGGSARRQDIVAQFQDPKGPRVIVVSLRAGGVGVTLTRADTVMHYDPWWNPAVERQATDRTHRLGQRNRVTVYRLICAQSIEERVMELAKKKDGYSELLLRSEGSSSGKRISEQDILSLLG